MFLKNILIVAVVFLVFSCQGSDISHKYSDNQDYRRNSRAGKFFGDGWAIFKGSSERFELKKSKLWRAAREVLARDFVIAVEDLNLRVIATEWKIEGNKRVKISVLVRKNGVSEEDLRVSVFLQRKRDGESWTFDQTGVKEGFKRAHKVRKEILRAM